MLKLFTNFGQRLDLKAIANLIDYGSSVLDLGCGNGDLLYYLKKTKNIKATGIEIDQDKIINCIKKGISVVQKDLNTGLSEFSDKSYDFVILSQTIQEVLKPDFLIEEMLRIGKKIIISFPNFGNLSLRLYLLFKGRMPKSKILPYEWYNTPNIHLLTYLDFIDYCKNHNIKINKILYLKKGRVYTRMIFPNLTSEACIFLISK